MAVKTGVISDAWNSASPKEIISKFPPDWREKLESKKWQERKEALEPFEELLVGVVRLKPGSYEDLIDALIGIIKKDVNILVVQLAAKILTGLANGLRKAFSPYSNAALEVILERVKEKKPMLTQGFREACDAIFLSTNLETISTTVLPFLSNKNPTVRLETAAFLDRCFTTSRVFENNKTILALYIPPLLAVVNDQAGEVREAAFETLGCLHAFAGEKAVDPLLTDIDQIRLAKIHEVSQKRTAIAAINSTEAAPVPVVTPDAGGPKLLGKEATKSPASLRLTSDSGNSKKSSSRLLSDPKEPVFVYSPRGVDISPQLTEELLGQLDDKTSYKARKEAIDKVLEIINEAKLIQPKLGDLPTILVKRLKEANKVLVQSALTVCEQLAVSMGKKTVEHIAVLGPAILLNLCDCKPQIRQQVTNCMDIWVDQCGGNLAPFFDNLLFSGALQTGNSILRADLLTWLSKRLPHNQCKLPKDDLIASIPFLLSALEDRSAEVRKAGQDALLPFMIHTGYEPFESAVEALKPASKDQLAPIIEKARQHVLIPASPSGVFNPPPPVDLSSKNVEDEKPASATDDVLPQPIDDPINKPLAPPVNRPISASISLVKPVKQLTVTVQRVKTRPVSVSISSTTSSTSPNRIVTRRPVSAYSPAPPTSPSGASKRPTTPKAAFKGKVTVTLPVATPATPRNSFQEDETTHKAHPANLPVSSKREEIVAKSPTAYKALPTSLPVSNKNEEIISETNSTGTTVFQLKIKLNEVGVDRLVRQACALAKTGGGNQQVNVKLFEQADTFFNGVSTGRQLKLREEFFNSQPNKAQLITYPRLDSTAAGNQITKCSDYSTTQFEHSEAAKFRAILGQSLGVRGVVVKTRTTIMVGQARIHVDQVKSLGNFLKLEVFLNDDQTAEDGKKIVEDVLRNMKVPLMNIVTQPYIDLLAEKAR